MFFKYKSLGYFQVRYNSRVVVFDRRAYDWPRSHWLTQIWILFVPSILKFWKSKALAFRVSRLTSLHRFIDKLWWNAFDRNSCITSYPKNDQKTTYLPCLLQVPTFIHVPTYLGTYVRLCRRKGCLKQLNKAVRGCGTICRAVDFATWDHGF